MSITLWVESVFWGEWRVVKAKRRVLAERREVMGHTQETLAEFVGVEPNTVGRWERGKTSP
ncbi:MAG: helix-turn-helix transcriptional regulator [Pseudonocardiaceae bacterium]